MGHSVTVIATSPQNRLRLEESWIDGVHLVLTPDLLPGSLRSGWDLYNSLRRILWLRSKRYDLVHAFEARPTVLFPMLYLQRTYHTPVVMDWADWFGKGGSVEQRPNPVTRFVLRPIETHFEENYRSRATATTVICSELKARAKSLGIPEDRIRLIYNGCNTDQIPYIDPVEARRQVKLPQDGKYIGYVGSIFRSDAELMAQAFDIVVEQVPGVRLVLAGYFPFDFRKMTRFPDAVHQVGFLESPMMYTLLSSCDLFWLPLHDTNANRGRWPLKLNDYMAIGRPCVATAVGDVEDLMKSEPIGLLCRDEGEDLAQKTMLLLADQSRSDTMGKHARELAEGSWNWSEKTNQLAAFYEEALREPAIKPHKG